MLRQMMRAKPRLAYLLLCSLCAPLNVDAQSSILIFRPTGLAQALVLPNIASVAVSGIHTDNLCWYGWQRKSLAIR